MQNTYLVAVKGCCSYPPVSGPKIIHCYISKEMSACFRYITLFEMIRIGICIKHWDPDESEKQDPDQYKKGRNTTGHAPKATANFAPQV
jgi:hypothetical protein